MTYFKEPPVTAVIIINVPADYPFTVDSDVAYEFNGTTDYNLDDSTFSDYVLNETDSLDYYFADNFDNSSASISVSVSDISYFVDRPENGTVRMDLNSGPNNSVMYTYPKNNETTLVDPLFDDHILKGESNIFTSEQQELIIVLSWLLLGLLLISIVAIIFVAQKCRKPRLDEDIEMVVF